VRQRLAQRQRARRHPHRHRGRAGQRDRPVARGRGGVEPLGERHAQRGVGGDVASAVGRERRRAERPDLALSYEVAQRAERLVNVG
jgi:hypothetical protein